MRYLFAGFICLYALNTQSAPMLEKVIDGDTVLIRDDTQRYRLRLRDIDAPELHQAYGKQSQRNLRNWCQPPIVVEVQDHDRYGRVLGHLYCNGVDASEYQIRTGMAWFNTRYSQRTALEPLQNQAQQAGLGLWQQTDPIPPWQWRQHYGTHYPGQK